MSHRTRAVACIILALPVVLLFAGCSGASVTFAFGPSDQSLKPVTVARDATASNASPAVAQIDLTGLIADRQSFDLLGGGTNPVNEFVVRLARAGEDPAVRAVVLRSNSPGGTVAAADTLYDELVRFRESSGKPVVISLGEVAASGGYYTALAADEIVAQPSTLTGSIGVIIPTVNVSSGLTRLGIDARSITSGPNKDLANPLEPRRAEHDAILQDIVAQFYAAFKAKVTAHRTGVSPARLDALTDGRILTGADAHEAGLVDHVGDVRFAFERAKSLAGLSDARLIKYLYEDSNRPRSPYSPTAAAPTNTPAASNVNVNTGLQFSLDNPLATLGPLQPTPHYLWLPVAP